MATPISPDPRRSLDPRALPPYLSNGVLGLRLAGPPFRGGTTIVNGFAGLDPTDGVEGFARAPFALGGDLELDGSRASVAGDGVRLIEQRYDFATAELLTTWDFTVGDATLRIDVVSTCSRSLPAIARQEVTLRVDRAADVAVSGGVDQTGVSGRAGEREQPPLGGPNEGVDGRMTWWSHGDIDRLGIAYATQLEGITDAERTTSPFDQQGVFGTTYRWRARAGRRYRFRLVTAMVPELSHQQPAMQAARIAALTVERGWEGMREEDRRRWEDLWRARIELDVDDGRWQAITDASLFYLLTSVHPSSLASASLFGLAFWPDYHYYHGHVMWDIETFTVPPLTLLYPDAARAILDYRARNLRAAQNAAALAGRRGALYPWESCPLHGEEVTPGARPGLQDHVSLDVALALDAYVNATGDLDEGRRLAWPVMRSVAEYVESRVTWTARGAEWLGTLGPREHYVPIDNNAFVNMAAVRVLDATSVLARRLGIDPPSSWERIARSMRIPIHRRGMIINHDRARLDEPQGDTPEGAAGLYPVGYAASERVEQATYRYAVEAQAPSYVGRPMLSPLLAVFAARAGDRGRARELLERGYGDFIDAPFLEPDEFPVADVDKPRAAPMFAHIGGYLTDLLFGFTGIQPDAGPVEGWPRRRVALPEGWRGIHARQVVIHRRPSRIDACDGDVRATISPIPDRAQQEDRP